MTAAGRARRGSIACLVVVLAACTSGGDDAGDDAADTTAPSGAITSAEPTVPPVTTPTAATDPSTVPTTVPATEPAVPTSSVDPASTPAPADTGVPGLDSDDAFCAAWSRFGGSWQVTLGASAFGSPADAARLEVIASTVVGDAYDALFVAWPEPLAAERDVVADQFFGAFQRRSADALAALVGAGADPTDIAELGELWVAALAARDPGNPVLAVDVPEELAGTVLAATDAFTAQRPPFMEDPSMVITASTPLTDDYLLTACPDQGSIFGEDV